ILAVVLYHAHVPGVTGGYVGVDVFFVISGFLITRLLAAEIDRDGRVSLARFWSRRVRRLFPAAAPVIVATLLAARFWLPPLEVRSLGLDAIFTSGYALNYRLAALGVDYQKIAAAPSAFQHFWSIAVEEQFYLAWPLILGACAVALGRRWRRIAVPLLIAVVVYSLHLSVAITAKSAPLAYFSLQTRAWELGLGALLAFGAAFGAERFIRVPAPIAAAATWAGLGAIVVTALSYTDRTPFPGSAALVPVLGAAAIVAFGAQRTPAGAEVVLSTPALQGIGRVSYSWYLWHWPLLVLLPRVLHTEFSWVANVGISALSLGIAAAAYVLVERPALRSRVSPATWLGTGAALSAVAVATAVVAIASLPSLVGSGRSQMLVTTRIAADARYAASVTDAIARSALIRAVPRNLAPPIADAPAQRPASSSDGCQADYLATEPLATCVYGDRHARKTLVLFGDSHAAQWLPTFTEAAVREHWKVVSWTKSRCPASKVSVSNSQLKRAYTECDIWRRNTIDAVRRLRPDLIVASQSDGYDVANFDDTDWARVTVATLREMSAGHVPVVYLNDTPVAAVDVPTCLSEHLGDARACGRPSDPNASYSHPHRHALLAQRLSAAGYTVVEPRRWFCTTTWCPVVIGNILVYVDYAHMTTTYSKWLAPLVQPLLRHPPDSP
ncbi:MAG: hypothetical protein QOI55_2644, partial [Actinomycetota bacterium]|nr:hypothetical protein [Actinomycetota bacterium]